jgi:hypothetical protein
MATKAKTTKTTRSTSKTTSTSKTAQTKKAAPRKRATKSASSVSNDDIARKAYMLWLQRGGSDIDNWLEAERQLR